MANEQANTPSTPDPGGSPFTRPGFLISAALVALILVLGVVVAVRVAAESSSDTSAPPASTSPVTTPSSPTSASVDPAASVCGLPPGADTGPLTSPPAVTWAFQGTIAYPTSPEFGAGKTAPEGYRYCFQRSPAGALVMAANAFAQGSDQEIGDEWIQHALSEGTHREQLMTRLGTSRGSEGTRVTIAGFRILSYDGKRARVDLGVQASSQSQTLSASSVYELVWQAGDWKINADVERPLDVATVPDLNGYVPWGE